MPTVDLFQDLQPALHVASYVQQRAQELVNHIRVKQPGFTLAVSVDASPRRAASNGGLRRGKPHISIATFSAIRAYRHGYNMTFNEYASVAGHPIIGTLRDCSWQAYLDCLIAHEVAHAYLYWFNHGSLNDHHGPNWQRTYAILRPFLLNQPRS